MFTGKGIDLDELYKEPDEKILAVSVKAPEAFEFVVSRYETAFLRKAMTFFGGNEDDAKDAVQEAFVKIYLNAGRFRPVPGATFKSWGYKILVNTCLTMLKKRGRDLARTAELEPDAYEAIADPENHHETYLVMDEVLSVLSKMPETLREILLPALRGKAHEDIAKEKGLTLGAFRVRLHRARKEFKKINVGDV